MNGTDPQRQLAQRLRDLREGHLPGKKITQPQLARALRGVSVSLVSSWESTSRGTIPPSNRLDDYARLFATTRSFDSDPPRLLAMADLTAAELRQMNELRSELQHLRGAALRAGSRSAPISDDPLRFDDGSRIAIVCARLPQEMLDRIPYTNIADPDYIDLLTYSDLDSLFELYGHIRAVNPASAVVRRVADKLEPPEYQAHLAVLGGVDWNTLTSTLLDQLRLPVRQVAEWHTEGAQYFEVEEDGAPIQYRPVLQQSRTGKVLVEDVALFARAVNPYNRERFVTICTGMYGRGTYGAVRALTDPDFRVRNAEYLRAQFDGCDSYCILTRVPIVSGQTLTPDWSSGQHTLFRWSTPRG